MDTINTIIENEIEHYQYKAMVYCNEKNISLESVGWVLTHK